MTKSIPKTDYIGQELSIGDKVSLFSNVGIHYSGVIKYDDGQRYVEVGDDYMAIFGLGTLEIMKDKEPEFTEVPYTIEIDWEGENVWINNHISMERMVITKKDSDSISNAFKLIQAKKDGLF